MKIHYATISETGRRRNNEDAFRIVISEDGRRWLAMVCDGMGGHTMGEVASETVSDAIADYWKEHTEEPDSETKVNNACAHAMRALDKKLSILKQLERYGNYNKLTAALHPMAYWQGDTCHDVLLTEKEEE